MEPNKQIGRTYSHIEPKNKNKYRIPSKKYFMMLSVSKKFQKNKYEIFLIVADKEITKKNKNNLISA